MPALISADAEKQAVNAYRSSNPLAKFAAEVKDLKQFRLSDEENDWKTILNMIHKFREWL